MPAKIAAQKFVTSRGEYSLLAIKTVRPLIIIMNNPSVYIMTGKDKSTRMGFKTVLIIAKTNPAIIITFKLSSYEMLLLTKLAAIHNPRLLTSQRVKNRVNGVFISSIVV